MKIETLRWVDNRLEMIDQRLLPVSFEYLACDSAASVAQAIHDMVVRGAPAIGVAAAYGVALEAMRLHDMPTENFNKDLESGFTILAQSRPTAVNLFWALERMRRVWSSVVKQEQAFVAQHLLAEAHEILAEDIRINRIIGEYGAALLPDEARVLTHCNAGALATAGHGTALGIIRSAHEAGKRISVIADETRPFLQGARLTAWEMMQERIPVTLITDSMAGFMMSHGEIDAVIVGADRVASNGDVANKIGTYMVAVLARRHNIPFYVACPLSTIDMTLLTGDGIPIEERPGSEVKGYNGMHWVPEGVAIRNPAFDVTPAELVTALVTERGVVYQPDKKRLHALWPSTLR
ncbi:MAG TPA: S-methyl-5-thioribose-1-phosphate isomerase [Burkholderiales bacterium]|nr:S-methyl-5-thioribose-1-phosphate isomerase [Burkholderiales bacterium]